MTDPSIATALTYDRVTQEYHDKRRDRSLAQERLDRIGILLGPGRHRILDLGCGPGYDAALMTELSRVRPTPPRHRGGVASMA